MCCMRMSAVARTGPSRSDSLQVVSEMGKDCVVQSFQLVVGLGLMCRCCELLSSQTRRFVCKELRYELRPVVGQ